MTITMSYGGGKQSVAIVTMILEGKLPKPDIIVMADTDREVKTTFEYLEEIVQPALGKVGMRVEIARHDLAKVDLYAHNGDLLLPVFTRQRGKIGKMPTFCSNEWKQWVVRRWLRKEGVNDADVWIGISTDEAERMKMSGLKWYRHIYPLIELVPTNRMGCIKQVERYGWPAPHKSRCYMCPNQSPLAWRDMKERGDGDFDMAVELEKKLREKDPDIYFHPLAIPLDQAVDQSAQQMEMFDGCDSGYCMT